MRGDFKEVTYGYCKCGCGQKTKISPQTHKMHGYIKGEPRRFIPGHNMRFNKDHPKWSGGRTIAKDHTTNYALIRMSEHPRNERNGYVREHILVAEKINGGPLPKGAVIHHIDFNGLNNKESNLMIFPNSTEHTIFHRKLRRLT